MRLEIEGLSPAALDTISAWFPRYAAGFRSSDRLVDDNIRMKIDHTLRVQQEAAEIAAEEDVPEGFARLLQAAALLHDAGRFEQFFRYRTFSDADSEDHALLGWRILRESDGMQAVPEPQRSWLLEAVRLHSCAELPTMADTTQRRLCELLRDADKLEMVLADYARHGGVPDTPFYRELPQETGISPPVKDEVAARRPVSFRHVKKLNDLFVLQAGMVFDLNSRAAFVRVRARGVLAGLQRALGWKDAVVEQVFVELGAFVEARCALTSAPAEARFCH